MADGNASIVIGNSDVTILFAVCESAALLVHRIVGEGSGSWRLAFVLISQLLIDRDYALADYFAVVVVDSQDFVVVAGGKDHFIPWRHAQTPGLTFIVRLKKSLLILRGGFVELKDGSISQADKDITIKIVNSLGVRINSELDSFYYRVPLILSKENNELSIAATRDQLAIFVS